MDTSTTDGLRLRIVCGGKRTFDQQQRAQQECNMNHSQWLIQSKLYSLVLIHTGDLVRFNISSDNDIDYEFGLVLFHRCM